MFGPHWDDNAGYQNTIVNNRGYVEGEYLNDSNKFGIIPRSIEHIFTSLNNNQLSNKYGNNEFTVYCSFLQIYNEKLFDLLQDKESNHPLYIREDKFSGIFVEGQSEYVVTNAQDCFTLL